MSLVDPQARWWRDPRAMRAMRASMTGIWIAAGLGAAVLGWAATSAGGPGAARDAAIAILAGPVPVVVVLVAAAALVLHIVWTIVLDRPRAGWPVARFLGSVILGAAVGALVAGPGSVLGWLGVVVGLGLLAARPVAQRRGASLRRRRAAATGNTTAVVTRVVASEAMNRSVWIATLRFVDGDGRVRWFRARALRHTHAQPVVGETVPIRFDPAHPGRRSALSVTFRRVGERPRGPRPMPPADGSRHPR